MEKLTIQEIAAVLTEKNGFSKRDANNFVSALFALIQEGLEIDQQVKVKGLGTFKLIDVEARESISVRTGERVTISGHAKVSFTPDAMMKELVNKPFSQFETVVLNDGVAFDDIKDEEEEDNQPNRQDDDMPNEEPVVAESVTYETHTGPFVQYVSEDPKTVEKEPTMPPVQPMTEVAEEETQPETIEESPIPQYPPMEQVVDKEDVQADEESSVDEENKPKPWGRWILCTLGVLALMAISAGGGYYYGQQHAPMLAVMPDTVVVHDTIAVAPLDTVNTVAESEQPDVEPAKLKPEEKAVAVAPIVAVSKEKTETETSSVDPYAAKDERVRLGAYRIVGLNYEVKVQAGQTFYSICRAHLGPDMECYIEVFNDLPRNPKLKEGQTLKIPKLQLKKRKKQ
jgi:nucleoid DNA-binding protein